MDEAERDLIRTRFCDLTLHTNCDKNFFMFFYSKRILTVNDIEDIIAENEGMDRASAFYKIIQTRVSAFSVLIEALKKFNNDKAILVLTGENNERVKLTWTEVEARVAKLLKEEPTRFNITFDVLPPSHFFTGRKLELEELHRTIIKSKNSQCMALISQITPIVGKAGIGKTQMARCYIQEKGTEFNGNVLWINATSEKTLSDSIHRLSSETLGLSTKDGNGKKKSLKGVFESVCKYFEGSQALFIFDNAEKTLWLRDLLPKSTRTVRFHSIITSRSMNWDRGVNVFTLGVLRTQDAISMLRNRLKINTSDLSQTEAVKILVGSLQCFPVKLSLALAYIYDRQLTESNYSVLDYLVDLQSKPTWLLSIENDISIDD